nr:MarR family transcriptional regulator [uncultured Cohaesibacter sp.]
MMHESNDELQLGYLIFEVSRLMRRLFEEEAKGLGLTMQQARVISFLDDYPEGISQRHIAQAIDRDPMTMSGILDRLQKQKLVSRVVDPSDSRAKLVLLTDEGKVLLRKARAVGQSIGQTLSDRVLSHIPDSQREALISGLELIRSELSDMSYANKDKEK